jgi:hypothetical protein
MYHPGRYPGSRCRFLPSQKIQWHGAIIAFTVAGQLPVKTVFPIISSMETLMVVKEQNKYTDEVKRKVSTSLFF